MEPRGITNLPLAVLYARAAHKGSPEEGAQPFAITVGAALGTAITRGGRPTV